jgi:hypothetical protein
MGPLRSPFRLLGRTRNKKSTVDDKEQGKRGHFPSVLTLQECESLQLALENELRSPRDQQIVEEQVSRFWGEKDAAILGMGASGGDCNDVDTTDPSSAFSMYDTMYFRDNTPAVDFEEEGDNTSLLLGSLREDDLPEEVQQAFDDRMSLLYKSSFDGFGPITSYDMYTVDPDDLGYEKSSSELDECCTVWASPPAQGIYSIVRPTDSVVVAALLKQEASQPNSPRYQNLPPDLYGMKRSKKTWKTPKQDKLLAQKEASAQHRVEAKRVKRDHQKKDFKHHVFSTAGLETVAELSFEDDQTIPESGKSRSKLKSRPRPPAIETVGLDYEAYDSKSDTSLTASTGSSGTDDPNLKESLENSALMLDCECYHNDKDDEDPHFDMSRTVSTSASTGSSGDPILDEVDLMNEASILYYI